MAFTYGQAATVDDNRVNPPLATNTSPVRGESTWTQDPEVLKWWRAFIIKHGGVVGKPSTVQRTIINEAGQKTAPQAGSYEAQNPYYHYEMADGTSVNIDPNGQIEQGSVKYGEKPISTHPAKGTDRWVLHGDGQGSSVLVRETVNDDHGTWTVDPSTSPIPFISGNNTGQTKYITADNRLIEIKPDGTKNITTIDENKDAREASQVDLANKREDRLTAAQERIADAERARNNLEARRLEIESGYRSGQLSLEQAKFEWDKEVQKVKDVQERARLELDQAKQAATEKFNQESIEKGREASRASTAAELYRSDVLQRDIDSRFTSLATERDVQAQANIYNTLGQVGKNVGELALGSLPFMAPAGTSEDMAALENSLTSGGGLGSVPKVGPRSTPFPFDPATLIPQAMAEAQRQLPPEVANTLNRKPGTAYTDILPPRITSPNINQLFPPGSITFSGQNPQVPVLPPVGGPPALAAPTAPTAGNFTAPTDITPDLRQRGYIP